MLKAGVPWELEIVGPREIPDIQQKTGRTRLRAAYFDRIRWTGYVPNGKPLFERMRAADVLVLPTLSEGTPHVLVEARANGLPCISTKVGGVPNNRDGRIRRIARSPKKFRALWRGPWNK